MDAQPEIHRDWSSLPADLLSVVLQRLKNNETDCRRLRAVCTSWRSSLAPPRHSSSQLPRKLKLSRSYLLCVPFVFSRVIDYRLLRQSIFYVISLPRESSSAGVWLTSVEESSSPNTWKLQNPMSAASNFKSLRRQAQVSLSDHRISEVARSYYLSVNYDISSKTAMYFFPESEINNGNFSLLTLMYLKTSSTNLILFNSGEDKWVIFPEVTNYADGIISYQGKFYANDRNGGLIAINPITFEVKEIIKQDEQKRAIWHTRNLEANILYTYMLESCGRLYLVEKFVLSFEYDEDDNDYGAHYNEDHPLELRVYVLSHSCSSNGDISHYWEPVTSLGDKVFFLGKYVNFSLSAQELAWEKGNCVIFIRDGFRAPKAYLFDDDLLPHESKNEHCKRMSRYFGVYTLEDGKILIDDDIPSEYVNLFWPVPSWLAATSTR